MHRVDQPDPEDLQGEHAAEEREQVPPPSEHDQPDDQDGGDRGHRPTGGQGIDRPGDVRHGIVAPFGDRPQDRRVELLGRPPNRFPATRRRASKRRRRAGSQPGSTCSSRCAGAAEAVRPRVAAGAARPSAAGASRQAAADRAGWSPSMPSRHRPGAAFVSIADCLLDMTASPSRGRPLRGPALASVQPGRGQDDHGRFADDTSHPGGRRGPARSGGPPLSAGPTLW